MRLGDLLGAVSREVREPLDAALDGRELSWRDALPLAGATGVDLLALGLAADALRRRQVGDRVTWVVNRNINFTNVCIKHCGFCAFSREHTGEEGYFLPVEEIVRRTLEAEAMGATEVCVQAGLPPHLDGMHYVELTRAVKKAAPAVHIHAFSPEEVLYGVVRSKLSIEEYLIALREAGLGSLPGTSAEILDDRIRDRIAKGRISTADWIRVITTAHRLGIPTTSTMMYGHIESAEDQLRHLELLRSIQRETGGFTEFVPLSFVHHEAPMALKKLVAVKDGPTGVEVLRVHAIARIMLGATIKNVQTSWVKDGIKLAQTILSFGANDLGGTLINESISTSAGSSHGQLVPPRELRRAIREAGRLPAERTTLYAVRRVFDAPAADEDGPLDAVSDAGERFGSYAQLVASGEHRFRR
jgi:FO synthase subunit 2